MLVNVPTLVIFGWALVVNVPVRYVALTKLPPDNELLAPNVVLVNVPTLVIFGWAAVVNVPVT